jgi:hypothetical protein
MSEGMVVLFLNFTASYTLVSAVLYQRLPFKVLRAEVAKAEQASGRNIESEVPAFMELHSDILSRIDNARAPSGSYVEYSKNMEQQKFAIRFK